MGPAPVYYFMKNDKLISKEIDHFYSQTSEEGRLELGLGPLEYERNQDLIGRYLPAKKGIVIDVGGGPGIYAAWLAGLGHEVILIDPVEKHIKQANKRAAKLKNPFKAIAGESRKLEIPDHTADVVILHGPLYHLQAREDRIRSIREAARVLKPGGVVLGFAINHAASSITGLLNGMMHQPDFYQMCLEELQTGMHNPPASWPGILPEAYFHKPSELKEEFEETGLSTLGLLAVEGMIWLDRHYFESRSDLQKKNTMMSLLKATEASEALISLSPHMMIAGKKD